MFPEPIWAPYALAAALLAVILLSGRRRRVLHGAAARAVPIGILIIVRNREDEIEGFMRPLLGDAGAGSWPVAYELVVVDAGSSDDTWAILSRLAYGRPELRVLRWHGAAGADPFQVGRLMCRRPVTITVDLTGDSDLRSAWLTLARLMGGVPSGRAHGSSSSPDPTALPVQADQDPAGP